MKNKKDEITIKSIWKWLRSKKGKRYSFFIFYIFFFIFVFIFISLPSNMTIDNNNNDNNLPEETLPYSTKNLEENDYKFTYVINNNNSQADYVGEKENNNIVLRDDRGEYIYTYQNGELKFNSNETSPALIKFLDIYEIKKIIKNSKLVSETKLITDNNYLYTYIIKTSDLLELYEEENEAMGELNNSVSIKTNSQKQILEIKLDVLGYMKTLEEETIDKYEIIITYEENNE